MSQSNQIQQDRPRDRTRENTLVRPKKDLSHIQCYKCELYGPYASDFPTGQSSTKPAETKPQTISAFVEYEEDNEETPPVPARVLTIEEDTLPTDDDEPKPTMAVTKGKARAQTSSSKTPNVLQRPKSVQKGKQPQAYNPPTLPPHILKQIEEFNASNQQPEPEEEVEEMDTQDSPSTQPNEQPDP